MKESAVAARIHERFQILEHVNSGFFGSVYKARSKVTGEIVAIKIINVTPSTKACVDREISLSCDLKNDNIIHTYEVIKVEEDVVALVQEYGDNGDLFDYVNSVGFAGDEQAIKGVFRQIVEAVAFLHTAGISHRDIKPENVALTKDMSAKLIDFGLAEMTRYVRGHVGTDPYCAPEVYQQMDPDSSGHCDGVLIDGFAADVFSLGVTLVAMITGRLPWAAPDESVSDTYSAFMERYLTHHMLGAVFQCDPTEIGTTKELCSLLDGMLNPDPQKRITADDILIAVDLPWFTNDNEDQKARICSAVTSSIELGALCEVADCDSGMAMMNTSGDIKLSNNYKTLQIFSDDEGVGDELPPLPHYLLA